MRHIHHIAIFLFLSIGQIFADSLSEVIASKGFQQSSVVGIIYSIIADDGKTLTQVSTDLSPDSLFQIFSDAKRSNVRSIRPRFAVTLLTGSSMETQKLIFYTDETGAIYSPPHFPRGSKNDPIWNNPKLFQTLFQSK
jgi:hypothetical protein